MITVPVIFLNDGPSYNGAGDPSFVGSVGTKFSGPIVTHYPDSGISSLVNPPAALPSPGIAGCSVTPTVLPVEYIGEALNGTISYPDTEDFYGTPLSYRLHHPVTVPPNPNPLRYKGGFAVGSANITVVARIGHDYTFTLTGFAQGIQQWNGTNFTFAISPITAFEMKFGGESVMITDGIINTGRNASPPYGEFDRIFQTTYTKTLNSSGIIKLRAIDYLGRSTAWATLRLAPVADFTIDSSDYPIIKAGGGASFDPDGSIVEYEWFSGFTVDPLAPEKASRDFSDLEDVYDDDTDITISLRVKDNDGLYSLVAGRTFPFEAVANLSLLYDRRTGELRTLYKDAAGALRCARNFKIEKPTLDTSQPLLSSNDKPGRLVRFGTKVFAVSQKCVLYESKDAGATWNEIMTLIVGAKLLGLAKANDGSTLYALALSGATVRRIVARGNGTGWTVQGDQSTSGLPAVVKAPADLEYDGVRFSFAFKSGADILLYTSTDEMKTWKVQP